MWKILCREYIFDDPTPTPECHAATLVRLQEGGILAAWFAGTKEANEDVMIWASRRSNGRGWSAPVAVTPEAGIVHWNPVLFRPDGKTVALYYKLGGPPIADWKTMVMYSTDEGASWSVPKELVPGDGSGGRGPVKNKAIRLLDGTILAPCSVERGPWRCYVERSTDNGKSWDKLPVPVPEDETVNMIQPTLWESAPGQVHALVRTNRGRIWRSDSVDAGQSWATAYPTAMPNNNSGIDCVRLADGRILLVCNPCDADWGARTPLTVFASRDNGETFEKVLDLETAPGEYSYPAIIEDAGEIFIAYTWNRRKIAFCHLTECEE